MSALSPDGDPPRTLFLSRAAGHVFAARAAGEDLPPLSPKLLREHRGRRGGGDLRALGRISVELQQERTCLLVVFFLAPFSSSHLPFALSVYSLRSYNKYCLSLPSYTFPSPATRTTCLVNSRTRNGNTRRPCRPRLSSISRSRRIAN